MLRGRSRDHGPSPKGREKGKQQESSASEEACGSPKELIRKNYAGMSLSKRDAIEEKGKQRKKKPCDRKNKGGTVQESMDL